MLTIKTILAPSKINGTGLFTVFPIKKGRKVWEYNFDLDIWKSHTFIKEMEDVIYKGHAKPDFDHALKWTRKDLKWFKKHAYKDIQGIWVLCGDNTKFMNHSFSPNLITRDGADYTVRDIKSGEELTIDYSTFDIDWKRKLKGSL